MRKLCLLGSGGHSRAVEEVALNFYNSEQVATLSLEQFESLPQSIALGIGEFLVAIGDITQRVFFFNELLRRSLPITSLVSPHAILAEDSVVGFGSIVMPSAVIRACSEVGANTIVNTGVVVDHDSVIGESSNLSPGALVCGSCTIGSQVLIGAGAVVVDGISICSGSVIGAGAVVIRDIDVAGTYVGNPARRIK